MKNSDIRRRIYALCGCSTSVVRWLPKPDRRVRLPSAAFFVAWKSSGMPCATFRCSEITWKSSKSQRGKQRKNGDEKDACLTRLSNLARQTSLLISGIYVSATGLSATLLSATGARAASEAATGAASVAATASVTGAASVGCGRKALYCLPFPPVTFA